MPLDACHPGWLSVLMPCATCLHHGKNRASFACLPVAQVVRVSLPELRRLMLGGDMLLPSVATCFLALERLQQLGCLGEQDHRQQNGQQQPEQQQQQQQQQQEPAPS